MATDSDIIIIGGGIAGLTSAIHLAKEGLSVIVLEKSSYPKHKVCGEYISNEVLPYLNWLGVDIKESHPVAITHFEFSTTSNTVTAKLPLGGFGLSRYALDYILYQKAVASGCIIYQNTTVTNVVFKDDLFTITANDKQYISKSVVGTHGKRSNIDSVLYRKFMKAKSPWLAVKAHYKGDFPDKVVALYNFKGGYCGVSKVENDVLNICYLANYKTFKRYKDIEAYQKNVLYKNEKLKAVLESSSMIFEKPLTISQVNFDKKKPVENHIVMAGDTAGLIHPLCGNGMAMAMHGAKIASELLVKFHKKQISRAAMEKSYTKAWHANFGNRLAAGRLLDKLLQHDIITNVALNSVTAFNRLLPAIIKNTHGRPIQTAS